MKRYFKLVGKWTGILALLYIAFVALPGVDFQTRIGWFIAGLAMAIAYVDGSLKDRISNLEHQIDELNRRWNGERW